MVRIPKIEEPKFDKPLSNLDLIKSLNWYHENKESREAPKFVADFMKKNKIEGKIDSSKVSPTLGWLCRLNFNGNDIGESSLKFIRDSIPKVLEKTKVVVDVPKGPSIQDRMTEKVGEIAGELEGAIDDFILSNYKDQKSPFVLMQDRAKGMHANRIVEIFKRRRAEFDYVLTAKEPDIKEAYSNFNKSQLKKLVAYCDMIIMDAMKISGEAKSIRKPRKRKVKTPQQLISKLNFLKECEEYKLNSVDPKKIIGATQLWVFNVKYKKIGVYHAEDASGFTIKGSSILNFSESKSITKSVRKPNDVLTIIKDGGKVALRNLMSSLKTKETLLTGRINKDIILLRVS
jgi:hypothetical protein